MALGKSLARALSHMLFRPDAAKRRFMGRHCRNIRNKRILEIGSGKQVNGKHIYSVRDRFDSSNKFECTDIDPSFGHKILDITKMRISNRYDIIICFNVLEHVFDFHPAIENMHRALKKNGQLLVLVPAFYPLHDEPHDYWRYTEHSLGKLFSIFKKVSIEHFGIRQYPFSYFVAARK